MAVLLHVDGSLRHFVPRFRNEQSVLGPCYGKPGQACCIGRCSINTQAHVCIMDRGFRVPIHDFDGHEVFWRRDDHERKRAGRRAVRQRSIGCGKVKGPGKDPRLGRRDHSDVSPIQCRRARQRCVSQHRAGHSLAGFVADLDRFPREYTGCRASRAHLESIPFANHDRRRIVPDGQTRPVRLCRTALIQGAWPLPFPPAVRRRRTFRGRVARIRPGPHRQHTVPVSPRHEYP